ncbi:MAG TPA: LytTR family DNA-binding domain-containing protein [Caldimonas sp.]|jgi:two-component system LytT family response regulator|nr:LytTR family DNA-binding domain-containing protein [Caldimonas sp.]
MTLRHRTLIAEDEPLASESLSAWVSEMPMLELVGCRGDGVSALQAIRDLSPSLVLMDIHMPGMTGLEVLRAIAADPGITRPAVILTTAYDQHAITAFELHAVDYLLKPLDRERFEDAIHHALSGDARERALSALESSGRQETLPLTRLLVRDQGKIVPVLADDIEHLRADTKYTAIATRGHTYLVRLPITSFEERLDRKRFLKVNRSCIVNLDFVESMTPDGSSQLVLRLRDGSQVTASREISKQLRTDSL